MKGLLPARRNTNLQDQFHIEILSHHWIRGKPSVTDPCSHGEIKLVVGGRIIADAGMDLEYGSSEGALGLLRTLDSDYTPPPRMGMCHLIPHGCGTLLMLSCPIGIEWTVKHLRRGKVHISHVLRYETTNEDNPVRFARLHVIIPEAHYRHEIARFAREVKNFFTDNPRRPYDEFDRDQLESFWAEFDERLARAEADEKQG